MRQLNQQEMTKVSGGYYFYDIIQGAEIGAFLGFSAFLLANMPLSAALYTGAMVGGLCGMLESVAYDIDSAMWREYYNSQPQPWLLAN
jgi:hypothetical protein